MEQSLCIIKLRYLVNKDIVLIGSATSISGPTRNSELFIL